MEEERREVYENQELIEYRLSNIEKTLAKMENLLASNKIQDRDIEDLKKENKRLDQRIQKLETTPGALEERIRKLEEAPLKAKADKWNTVFDTVFKMVLTACIGVVLVKVGLK